MLPQLGLDDENFEDILEFYKKRIPQINQEWTDFNKHDPGITFLELLSWMKELQQYHMDQIGAEQYKTYLKLLGMKQKNRTPARTYAVASGIKEEVLLLENTRIYAGNVLFETEEKRWLCENELLFCELQNAGGQQQVRGTVFLSSNQKYCPVFGEVPKKGDSFILWFQRPFSSGQIQSLFFTVMEREGLRRQKVQDGFVPLVTYGLELLQGNQRIPCTVKKDSTHGLLYTGEISFFIPPCELEEKNIGFRFTLQDGEYDLPPAVVSVEWNSVPVKQTTTKADYETFFLKAGEQSFTLFHRMALHGKIEIYRQMGETWHPTTEFVRRVMPNGAVEIELSQCCKEDNMFQVVYYESDFEKERSYNMDGFPYQKIDMENTMLLQDGVEILVENPMHKNQFEKYKRVDNFYSSKPESRHFMLDEERGFLVFGDCECGMAPKGNMRIIRHITSQGQQGNIKKNQLKQFEDATIPVTVTNLEDISNGTDKESVDACFERFQEIDEHLERAVTMKDYEKLVYSTPGLFIHKVKAVPYHLQKEGVKWDNTVTIIVKPFSYEEMPRLSSGYEKNIRKTLEGKRILGTKIQILSPDYVGIHVFAEMVSKPHYKNVRETVENAVRQYFSQELFEFGNTLVYGKLYGMLESLDCIFMVRNLSVQAQGKGISISANGDYQMPVNAMLYLKEMDFSIVLMQ